MTWPRPNEAKARAEIIFGWNIIHSECYVKFSKKSFQECKFFIRTNFCQFQWFLAKSWFLPIFATWLRLNKAKARAEIIFGWNIIRLEPSGQFSKKSFRERKFFVRAIFCPKFEGFFQFCRNKNDPNQSVLWAKMGLRMGEKIKKRLMKNNYYCGF